MRLFTLLKTRQATLVALAIIMVASTLFAAASSPFTQEASAATPEECYSKNSAISKSGDQSQQQCINLGYCKIIIGDIKAGTSTVQGQILQCNKDVYQEYLDAENRASILNTQTSPVVDIICAGITSSIPRNTCVNDVRQRYVICANGAEEGSPTEDQVSTAIATCMRNWAKTAYTSAQLDLDKLKAAVTKGRSEGSKQANEIGSLAEEKKQCETNGGKWEDDKCVGATNKVLCSGGALGWILCPVADMASSITSELGKTISSIMTFTPLLNSKQGKAIEAVWRIVVNIANILLVIAFLMVVFSQATSVGLTNYGIKKMLPKIVAAAILMNLSFFICAVAVDVTNIIGQSVAGIFQVGIGLVDAPIDGLVDGDVKSGSSTEDIAMFSLFGSLGVAGLIATGNIFIVLPVLASAAVAVFTAFAVIMLRQVAVVIMIIIAPLAFAAWILPNTESWFEKWRKLFVSLLLMFPLIMAIMYGATFMSRIMLATLDPTKSGLETNMVKVMAIAVLVLPLFAMPFIMKVTGGILERFGVWTNNRQKGIIDRSRKKGQDLKENRQNQLKTSALSGRGRFNPYMRNIRRVARRDRRYQLAKGFADESAQEYNANYINDKDKGQQRAESFARAAGARGAHLARAGVAVQASAQAAVDKIDRESVQNRETLLRAQIDPRNMLDELRTRQVTNDDGTTVWKEGRLASALRQGDVSEARAIRNILNGSGSAGIAAAAETIQRFEDTDAKDGKSPLGLGSDVGAALRRDASVEGLKPKDNVYATWAYDKEGRSMTSIAEDLKTYSALSDAELVGQSKDRIEAAIRTGALKRKQAQDMLDNAALRVSFSEDKRKAVRRAFGITETKNTAAKPAPQNQPPAPGSTPPSNPPTPGPTPPNNPPAPGNTP